MIQFHLLHNSLLMSSNIMKHKIAIQINIYIILGMMTDD